MQLPSWERDVHMFRFSVRWIFKTIYYKQKGVKKMNYYIKVLKNYAVFNGRAGRSEFWFFVLFSIIVSVVLQILIDRLNRLALCQ